MAAVGALIAMPLAGAAAHRYGSRAATAVSLVGFGARAAGPGAGAPAIGLGAVLLLFGAAFGALDVSMNAQGRRGREALLAPDHVVAARHVQPRRHGRRGGDRRWSPPPGPHLLPHFLAVCIADRAGRARRLLEDAAGGRGGRCERHRLRPPVARRCCCPGSAALAALLSEGADGRLERSLPERQPRRRHQHGGGRVRRLFARDGGRAVHRRPAGPAARRRSRRARRRRAGRGRSRPDAADRPAGGRGAWLRAGRRRAVLRRSRSCCRPRRRCRACRRARRSPRSARSATSASWSGRRRSAGLPN